MYRLKNLRGFTLIELLVSIAIIGIIAVPLLGLFIVSIRNNVYAKSKTETVAVAQSVMEWYKSDGVHESGASISGVDKLETLISTVLAKDIGSVQTGDTITLYVFYKSIEDLSTKLKNYDYFKTSLGTEEFDDMNTKAGSSEYDFVIKTVLTVKDVRELTAINITVWDRLFGQKSKINLVSLRSR